MVDAYLNPRVDPDEQPCQWVRPDLQGLRDFCSMHFNWNEAKARGARGTRGGAHAPKALGLKRLAGEVLGMRRQGIAD